jgi:hypothetical protein
MQYFVYFIIQFESLNFTISSKNRKKKWTRFLILDIFKNVHFQKMENIFYKKGVCDDDAVNSKKITQLFAA